MEEKVGEISSMAGKAKTDWLKVGIAAGIAVAVILGIIWILSISKSSAISAGDTVKFEYSIQSDGKVLYSNTSQIKVGEISSFFGFASDKIDKSVVNASVGKEIKIILSPEDAFGAYDSNLLIIQNRTSIIGNTSIKEINRTFDVSAPVFKQVFGEDAILNKQYTSSAMIWTAKAVSVSNDSVKLSIENKAGEKLSLDEATYVEIVEVSADKIKLKLGANEKNVSTQNGDYAIKVSGIYITATWAPIIGQEITYGYSLVRVKSFNDTSVVLDANNPYAGKNITIALKALGVVRKASASSETIKGAPTAKAYVFSYCPYGTQFEKGLIPVYNLLKSKVNIDIVFIGAMHGAFEETESLRQLCIKSIYGKDKFMSYITQLDAVDELDEQGCYGQDSCINPIVSKIMSQQGIDEDQINACMKKEGPELYAADQSEANSLGFRSSPTFVINGAEKRVNRDSESIKQAICSAFATQPSECSQTLDSISPAAGFGGSASGSGSDGGCG